MTTGKRPPRDLPPGLQPVAKTTRGAAAPTAAAPSAAAFLVDDARAGAGGGGGGGGQGDEPKSKEQINADMNALDEQGAKDYLAKLCETWRLHSMDMAGYTFEHQLKIMFKNFDVRFDDNLTDALSTADYGLKELTERINAAEFEAIALYHRLHSLGLLLERPGDGAEEDLHSQQLTLEDMEKHTTLRRILKVLEMVFYSKKVLLSVYQAKLAVHSLMMNTDADCKLSDNLDARLGSWSLRFRFINNKTTPMQNLLLHLLDGAMEKRYRKSGGWMYEPVFIDGQNTHAWKPVCDIQDYVYNMLQKETHWEQWCNATASGLKNINAAIEYLTNCRDYQLPWLNKQRGVYAFRNGVYIARQDRFYAFDDNHDVAQLSDDVVACKFIDDTFTDHKGDWRDIHTPHLQSIMDYQGFQPEVCRWMYIMLGRLLYPLNDLDAWQVIPFFKGAASSGKCMVGKTRILTFSGSYIFAEEVAVGDVLMGDDGTPRRVLELARGVDEMYTLVPRRKGYEELTVTGEHVLCLKYTNQGVVGKWKYGKAVHFFDGVELKGKARKFTKDAEFEAFRASVERNEVFEMTVQQYMALPDYIKRYLVCYRVPVDFAVTEAPLFDPWTIGVWLGDGTKTMSQVTNGDEDIGAALCEVAKASGETIAKRVSSWDADGEPTSYRYTFQSGVMKDALQTYGLLGNKHVPHALKTGSRETRMEVLAGMLDTDGWKNPCGYYEISQKLEVLADDVVFLARSLGFGATKVEMKKAAVKRAREDDDVAEADEDGKVRAWGTYWRVSVFGEGLSDIPLRCARKRFAAGELKPRNDARKWGFDVRPAGVQPYYGFQTDGNERFVLGDFTVTHNSTIILKVAKMFYDPQDVGVLSNNVERKFGLSAFYDKYLFVSPEIKGDFQCEQAEFQSIVSGEDLQVNVKHKKAFATTWSVPGVLAGNEVPAWADNSGSVQRRVILFEFARAVTNGDMKLGDKLAAELPAILLKCNKAYLEEAQCNSHANIWTLLPRYFKDTRDQLARSVNSVEAFLATPDVVYGEGLYCPMDDFRSALKAFETANNFKSKKYDTDFFRAPFDKYGLHIERCKLQYRGTNKTRDYVMGLDLNNVQQESNDLG